jgi:hypothetical protein
MLDRGVGRHQVEQHPEPAAVGGGEQPVEVLEGAVRGIDPGVVADVVAEVGHGGGVDRREPDRVRAEPGDVVEAPLDAGKVADAVAAGVLKRAGVDLVDDGVPPPRRHGAPLRSG